MPGSTNTPVDDSLERELHELEHEEERLEERTSTVERLNILTLLLALVAFGAAMIAIVLAISNDDNGSTGPLMHSNSSSSAMPGGMSGGGMMGSRSGGTAAPAGVRTVDVKLGEMWVRPQYTSVQAGKVTFVARNVGQLEHELMVERAPIAMDAPGKPNEEAAQGMIEDMGPGEGGQMTLKLKPGRYVLFCNVTGHYAAGQHVPFTVTSG